MFTAQEITLGVRDSLNTQVALTESLLGLNTFLSVFKNRQHFLVHLPREMYKYRYISNSLQVLKYAKHWPWLHAGHRLSFLEVSGMHWEAGSPAHMIFYFFLSFSHFFLTCASVLLPTFQSIPLPLAASGVEARQNFEVVVPSCFSGLGSVLAFPFLVFSGHSATSCCLPSCLSQPLPEEKVFPLKDQRSHQAAKALPICTLKWCFCLTPFISFWWSPYGPSFHTVW